ncbi:MAG: TonB-dependent receptor domain-containing protein [Burkholderiaceae bacterium]
MKKSNLLYIGFIVLLMGQAHAVEELPEIEVVGTSLLPGLEIEKEKLPYEVRSLQSENLGNETSLGIADVMNQYIPGVFTNEVQGSPYQGDVTYRGFRASSILGAAQGLSVYIDGIRINEPFGDVVNWDMIPEFALDNISLIPGSNPMYGLNTLGGALSLTTKSGLSHPGKVARVSFGSFSRKKLDISLAGKFSAGSGGDYFISASHFDESGWRDYSDGKISNIFGKANKNTDFGSVGIMTYFGDSDLLGNGLLPSTNFGVGDDVGEIRESGLYEARRQAVYSHPDQTKNEVGLISLNFQNYLDDDTQLNGLIYHRYGRQKRLGGDVEAEFESDENEWEFEGEFNNSKTRQNSSGFGLNFSKILDNHQITTGVTFDQSSVSYHATETEDCEVNSIRKVICDDDSETEDSAKVSGKSKTYSLFASDTTEVSGGIFVTGSLRYNHSKVENTLSTPAEGFEELVAQPKESFNYSKLNPALGISAKLDNGLNLFANASQGNRVPTVIELGCADKDNPCLLPTGLQADPFLEQVISRTYEIGARGRIGQGFGIISIYNTDNKDDIIFVSTDVNSGQGFFTNFGKTRNQGVDLQIVQKFNHIKITSNYSYLEATYEESGLLFGERSVQALPGMRIPGIPENVFRLGVDWTPQDDLKIGLTFIATSDLITQGNEDGQIGGDDDVITRDASVDGYQLVNLNMRYERSENLTIFARVTNLFDEKYETYGAMAESVFNKNGNFVGDDEGPTVNRFVAPGAPRGVFVGLNYKF